MTPDPLYSQGQIVRLRDRGGGVRAAWTVELWKAGQVLFTEDFGARPPARKFASALASDWDAVVVASGPERLVTV